MPTTTDILQIVAGAVLGGGGLAAWIRARGQNRNEADAQLTSEQKDFRKDLREQIAALTQRNEYVIGRLDSVANRNSELVQVNAKLEAKVEMLEARDEAKELKIDDLSSQLTVLFEERRKQDAAIKRLEAENMNQQKQIEQLRSENIDCHKLITEQSQLLLLMQATSVTAANTSAVEQNTTATEKATELRRGEGNEK